MTQEVSAIATYHHGDLRRVLLVEGRRLFEELGPSELSLREVARRAGVSVAAPSRHFRGKEGLLAAIATDGFAELAKTRKKTALAELEPLARCRAMMRSYVNFALAHEGLFDLMIGPRILVEHRDDEFLAVSEESFEYFAGSVRDLATSHGWPKRRLQDVTYAAWSMEHGIASLILAQVVPRAGARTSIKTVVDFSIDMFLSAVVAGPDAFERIESNARR